LYHVYLPALTWNAVRAQDFKTQVVRDHPEHVYTLLFRYVDGFDVVSG
jgi:hypothetical protein